MSDYVPLTNFGAKDSLTTGDPNKLVRGSEFTTEFNEIATHIATKYDSADLSSQVQAETGTDNTTLMTPLRVSQAIAALSGGGTSNPFTIGTGGTGTDAELVLDSGTTTISDRSRISWNHAGSFIFRIESNIVGTNHYQLKAMAPDLITAFWRGDSNAGVYHCYADTEWTFNENVRIDGDNQLNVDSVIRLNDETTNPGVVGWRIIGEGASAYNHLHITPYASWSGRSEVQIDVMNGSDTIREFTFDQGGNLTVPSWVFCHSQLGGSGDNSGVEFRNFDWSAENDGYYTIFATGAGTGRDTLLRMEPIRNTGTNYTGEISLIVGDTSGSKGTNWHEWIFEADGSLTRNGVVKIAA